MKLGQPGYSNAELEAAEKKWRFVFPPDYKRFLLKYRPEGDQIVDWVRSKDEEIQERLDWPLSSILFDIKNGFWIKTWPKKPESIAQRKELTIALISEAPKLIPVFGHRYIPDRPSINGNPILSVSQLDIIIYGTSCLLNTSPSARDRTRSGMPYSA